MLAFIAKRMLATIPVMGVVALFVFLMLRLSPGDPASIKPFFVPVAYRDNVKVLIKSPVQFYWNMDVKR